MFLKLVIFILMKKSFKKLKFIEIINFIKKLNNYFKCKYNTRKRGALKNTPSTIF